MKNKFIYPFENKLEFISYILLILLSSFAFHRIIMIFNPLISIYGRDIHLYIPTFVVLFTPLIVLIMFYFLKRSINQQRQLTHLSLYLMISGSICFIYQLFLMIFKFGFTSLNQNITTFFPYDILFYSLIFIVIGAFLHFVKLENRDIINITKKEKTMVVFLFFFASFFTSYILISLTGLDGININNFFLLLPFYLSLFIPIFIVFLYHAYNTNNLKIILPFAFTFFGYMIVCYIWICMVLIFNPVFLYSTIRYVYRTPILAGISFDFTVQTIYTIVMLIIFLVKILKMINNDNEYFTD